jgi:hypothetical protein
MSFQAFGTRITDILQLTLHGDSCWPSVSFESSGPMRDILEAHKLMSRWIRDGEAKFVHRFKALRNVVEDDVTRIHDFKMGRAILANVSLKRTIVEAILNRKNELETKVNSVNLDDRNVTKLQRT